MISIAPFLRAPACHGARAPSSYRRQCSGTLCPMAASSTPWASPVAPPRAPLKPCPPLSSPRLSPCRISDPCPSKPDPAGPAWAPQGARSASPPASSCQDPASQAPVGSAPSLLRPRCWPPVSPSPDSKSPLKPPGRLRSPPLPPWSWSAPRPGTLPPSSSRKPSLACPGPHAA